MAINTNVEEWAGAGSGSINSGERAWLLQSPSVESNPDLETEERRERGVSSLGAVFIVVNAALGAGLLNFPAAFNMAGGVTAGVMLQMVRRSQGALLYFLVASPRYHWPNHNINSLWALRELYLHSYVCCWMINEVLTLL